MKIDNSPQLQLTPEEILKIQKEYAPDFNN